MRQASAAFAAEIICLGVIVIAIRIVIRLRMIMGLAAVITRLRMVMFVQSPALLAATIDLAATVNLSAAINLAGAARFLAFLGAAEITLFRVIVVAIRIVTRLRMVMGPATIVTRLRMIMSPKRLARMGQNRRRNTRHHHKRCRGHQSCHRLHGITPKFYRLHVPKCGIGGFPQVWNSI